MRSDQVAGIAFLAWLIGYAVGTLVGLHMARPLHRPWQEIADENERLRAGLKERHP